MPRSDRSLRSRDYAFGVPSCGSMTADMGCFDRAGSSFGRSDFALDDRGIWLLTMDCENPTSRAEYAREMGHPLCLIFLDGRDGYPHISLCDGEGSRTGVPAPHGPHHAGQYRTGCLREDWTV